MPCRGCVDWTCIARPSGLEAEDYDYRNPTVKIAMPAKATTVYAKFVTKTEVKNSLQFSSETKKLAKTPAKATAAFAR